jgi:hypothetical protein
MTREQRLNYRNIQVRNYFSELEKKHPQWKLSALLEETAKRFPPISPSTVSAIIRKNGIYADS